MARIILPDNGQDFDLDDSVAGSDDLLKQALKPLYPEIGNAKISRETVDGVLTVKVVKQAGRKGAATIESVKAPAPEAEPVMLELERIRTDGGTQTRAQIDMDVAREYAEAMKAGAQFPPVLVVYDGTDYWLADGFHRNTAAHLAGWAGIWATVRQGTQRNAILESIRANQAHGLRRSNADKRRAVETLLRDEEWARLSNRAIGDMCGVAHTFVGDIRTELSGSGHQMPQERQVQRGTQSYTFTPAAPQPKVEEPSERADIDGEYIANLADGEGTEIDEEAAEDSALPDQLVGETAAAHDEQAGGPAPAVVAPAPSPAPAKPAPTPATPAPAATKALPWSQTVYSLYLTFNPSDGGQGGRQTTATLVVDDVPQGILVFRENDVVLPIQVRNAIDKLAAKVSERYEASGAPESK